MGEIKKITFHFCLNFIHHDAHTRKKERKGERENGGVGDACDGGGGGGGEESSLFWYNTAVIIS